MILILNLVNKDNNIIKKDLNYEFQDDKNYLSVSAAMFENLTSLTLIKLDLNILYRIYYLKEIYTQEINLVFLIFVVMHLLKIIK